jgi:uncharacterized membrane protein
MFNKKKIFGIGFNTGLGILLLPASLMVLNVFLANNYYFLSLIIAIFSLIFAYSFGYGLGIGFKIDKLYK